MKVISYTTDFGSGNKGHGAMQGVALKVCPEARIVELATNVNSFDLRSGARLFEAVNYLPIGFHVCVVDPGVGTKRKAIIIKTKRGDYLIGPDNGVMIPAAEMLGGVVEVHEITNQKYMQQPVSAVFHGRDIFISAAAHLANGVKIQEFGQKINKLVQAPFKNSIFKDGKIEAEVIDTNKFGSIFLNVLSDEMDNFELGSRIMLNSINILYGRTFGDVKKGEPIIFKDDFGRVEIACNMDNFSKWYKIKIGDKITIRKL